MNIAIVTGGGDAPGLNAVIRSAVLSSLGLGWTISGLRDGMRSLMFPQEYPDGPLIPLDRSSVRGITFLGGTILGTTNQANPLEPVDTTPQIIESLKAHRLDALLMVGGDGTMAIAAAIARRGFPVVGIPKTIDNDLDGTVVTFGFDTAVEFATQCIDRLHSTAESHGRVMVVEVMGRYAGWIALESGLAGTADVILIPEIPYKLESVLAKLQERRSHRGFSLVVIAEGAHAAGESYAKDKSGRLGGAAQRLVAAISESTGLDTRSVVLGHLLRGGPPNARDRLYSLRFGAAAVRALAEGRRADMVALDPPNVRYLPLEEATRRMKTVPLDCDSILTARSLGTCLGD
ncbi:MAG: ATP-dependent 6-phosphofructokinase [Vulcanimicrobiota bacterium]